MNVKLSLRCVLALLMTGNILTAAAQKLNMDKEQADQFVYESLNNKMDGGFDIQQVVINPSHLVKTDERSIFILKGGFYQSQTLRSDCYVRKNRNQFLVVSDKRYPVETFTNQLLDKVESGHVLHVKHHQYGQKIPVLKTSLKSVFALFLPTMNPYVSITKVSKEDIEALLVFHHPKLDFIHMLIIKTKLDGLLKKDNVIYGDFYTNIPQDNLKSILDN